MTTLPYALIGAGPAGLVAARNLDRLKVSYRGFELHTDVGGLWDIDNPHSTMYESAHLISSKTTTEVTEYPMNADVADYPSHREVCRYFRGFADKFDLRRHFRFSARVLRAEPLGPPGEGWRVEWEQEGERRSDEYAGVLIANGIFSRPSIPEFATPEFADRFDGEIVHSSDYRNADLFADKRVLVVGAGNSACDLAVDAVHRARGVTLSVRRGYHFVPKYVFGRPADTIGGLLTLPWKLKQKVDRFLLSWFTVDPTRVGFPEPDHALYESHPIVNSLILHHLCHGDLDVRPEIARLDGKTVHFKDGQHADYDLILLATGYHLDFPFIDREHLNWKDVTPHLYLNCFHPERDDLFVLGMVEAAGLGWQGRYEQAELVARFLDGCAKNTAAAHRFREIKREPFDDMRGPASYMALDRMAFYVHKDTFRKTVRKHISRFARDTR